MKYWICRECPYDLKEAISSIIFAAPRCADLPELQQVSDQFCLQLSVCDALGSVKGFSKSGFLRSCALSGLLLQVPNVASAV
jgi:hypothetical protein